MKRGSYSPTLTQKNINQLNIQYSIDCPSSTTRIFLVKDNHQLSAMKLFGSTTLRTRPDTPAPLCTTPSTNTTALMTEPVCHHFPSTMDITISTMATSTIATDRDDPIHDTKHESTTTLLQEQHMTVLHSTKKPHTTLDGTTKVPSSSTITANNSSGYTIQFPSVTPFGDDGDDDTLSELSVSSSNDRTKSLWQRTAQRFRSPNPHKGMSLPRSFLLHNKQQTCPVWIVHVVMPHGYPHTQCAYYTLQRSHNVEMTLERHDLWSMFHSLPDSHDPVFLHCWYCNRTVRIIQCRTTMNAADMRHVQVQLQYVLDHPVTCRRQWQQRHGIMRRWYGSTRVHPYDQWENEPVPSSYHGMLLEEDMLQRDMKALLRERPIAAKQQFGYRYHENDEDYYVDWRC
jgi:hypothetical protein